MNRIVVIEDDAAVSAALCLLLKQRGHLVEAFPSAELALDHVRDAPPALVFLDLHLPGKQGLEVLPELLQLQPAPAVVVVTAHPSAESAMDAVARGAAAHLEKPLRPAQLEEVLSQLLAGSQKRGGSAETTTDPTPRLIGRSRVMLELGGRIGALARSDVTVLLRGESGSGKEVVAQAIHSRSARSARPLVAVSCATLPEALFEAELFGSERGSYTGAHQARVGRVERAEGGTLFLDEVGELSERAQAKLLRFLEQRSYERVGGGAPRRADVRVLTATNASLEQRVEEGSFREDLYYRLNVTSLHVPALRERREDVPLLVEHFLGQAGRGDVSLSAEVQAQLLAREWPGNVRELKNVIQASLISLGEGRELGLLHLPRVQATTPTGDERLRDVVRDLVQRAQGGEEGLSNLYQRLKEELERELVAAALEKCGGNQVAAARLLDLNRATLRRKIAQYDLGQ